MFYYTLYLIILIAEIEAEEKLQAKKNEKLTATNKVKKKGVGGYLRSSKKKVPLDLNSFCRNVFDKFHLIFGTFMTFYATSISLKYSV